MSCCAAICYLSCFFFRNCSLLIVVTIVVNFDYNSYPPYKAFDIYSSLYIKNDNRVVTITRVDIFVKMVSSQQQIFEFFGQKFVKTAKTTNFYIFLLP